MSQESPHNSILTGQVNPSPQSTLPPPPEVVVQIETQQPSPKKPTKRKTSNVNSFIMMFEEMKGHLMVVAVLAAGATYQAGLSPPGGLWQANDEHGHIAGTPVLQDTFSRRYKAFFYCNATSFIMSLVIIILLINPLSATKSGKHRLFKAFKITMTLDLFGFMGAYAAGSCRELSASIYLFIMMGGLFSYIVWFAQHYGKMRKRARNVRALRKCFCMKSNPVKQELPN